MISRFLSARRLALKRYEESGEEYWQLRVHMFDRALAKLAFPFVGVLILLGCTIYFRSLQAFGGMILAIGFCIVIWVPVLKFMLHSIEEKNKQG